MKKIISLFVIVFFVSCKSQNRIAPESFQGNYTYVDSKQFLKIEILENNEITIEKKVEANRVKCIGNYKIISNKKIKIHCVDERNMHEANSIIDFVPLRFDIKNETVYFEPGIIKYKNMVLKKE
ncbi:hypothetical protein [Chryseobacterium sp. JM1]|uniref:hypothetical protein n=1 Tax=Chryseobacterium sp. JM1 TaxID=1233950 RepID=UPI0004E63395|nr:hypothetical protein [Chryseobacterium sp. JM1]KFF15515.1 hypothetical protein IW22_24270 [Chryseobacterium sp. JM1]